MTMFNKLLYLSMSSVCYLLFPDRLTDWLTDQYKVLSICIQRSNALDLHEKMRPPEEQKILRVFILRKSIELFHK